MGISPDIEPVQVELIPADPVEAMHFALGVLDVMSALCGTLIGRGVVEPNAFQDEIRKRAALWREKGNRSRGAASQLFLERLQTLEHVKKAYVPAPRPHPLGH